MIFKINSMSSFCERIVETFRSTKTQIHSSLAFHEFVLRGFENTRGRPREKVHHLAPSLESNNKTVRQMEQVFEPYCVAYKE